jgi:DNA-binding response OmpR family regulator
MGTLDISVLIVEDDELAADALSSGVRVAGYSVCGIAGSVDAAVELMRRHRPRLAVIDANLGDGGNGVEAARQLLRIGPVGIVYVTGHPQLVREADVGHAWMVKPHRLLDLINALRVVKSVSERAPIASPVPAELQLLPQRPPRSPYQ